MIATFRLCWTAMARAFVCVWQALKWVLVAEPWGGVSTRERYRRLAADSRSRAERIAWLEHDCEIVASTPRAEGFEPEHCDRCRHADLRHRASELERRAFLPPLNVVPMRSWSSMTPSLRYVYDRYGSTRPCVSHVVAWGGRTCLRCGRPT